MSFGLKGVKIPDSMIQEVKEVDVHDIAYDTLEFKQLLNSDEYKHFAESFNVDEDDSYITIFRTSESKYILMDGLKHLSLYRDKFPDRMIKAAIMIHNTNVDLEDLYTVLENKYEKKCLKTDIDRLRKAISIFKSYNMKENIVELSYMLDTSHSNVYRLMKIMNGTKEKLLEICLDRDISVRSAEAISTMSSYLQDALYNKFVSDVDFIPTEKVIKLIKDEGRIYDDESLQAGKIPNRTLGKAKKDREIIEKAIAYDRQRGVAIKDIDNISAKIVASNLISKQEDAVKALENRFFRIDYEPTPTDVSRVENVINRLTAITELMRKRISDSDY